FGGGGGSFGGGGSGGGSFGGGGTSGGGNTDGPDGPAIYTFKWDVNDPPSNNFYGHEEDRNGVNTQGRYYVRLPDSRLMKVEYYVDDWGYHPTVTFEGTAIFPPSGGPINPRPTPGPGNPGTPSPYPTNRPPIPTQPPGLYGLPVGR
ncbi:pro-resilin, partial [Hyalella azteca]